MKERQIHTVPLLEQAVRFQDYGVDIFNAINSKSGLKKSIKKGLITINGVLASTATFIKGGEVITLYELEKTKDAINPNIELEIIYEDDYLAVINKPPGVLVSGNKLKTIVNALPYNLKESSQSDALSRPLTVHRLDFPTSGLLLVAKTNKVLISLGKMFEENTILKTYHAVSIGSMQAKGSITNDINGKASKTRYEVLKTIESTKYNCLNLLKLFPESGRRHQIRIHLSGIGNPILGDATYGKDGAVLTGKGLFLCASSLEFKHPVLKNKLLIELQLPAKFRRLLSDFNV